MNKSATFSGNSVFGQLISLIPSRIISKNAKKHRSDRYTKRFTTWEHLITMLFCAGSNTTSLRDVVNGLRALEGKLTHLNLKNPPKRSTISDANKRRKPEVFESIYYALLERYKSVLSDSRFKNEFGKNLSIIDSTTIHLFKAILKCVGRKPKDGKHKGGIKVHMQIRADYNAPVLVKFTSAASNDSIFMNDIDFTTDQIYVFDKGYNNYDRFEYFVNNSIPFVTRLKHNATFIRNGEFELREDTSEAILLDEEILLSVRENGKPVRDFATRRVVFWDEKHQVCYEFITNIRDLTPDQIAKIYKCRWQIETLHKQLKQNQPLQYFLGDNENAIIIQIWCALIWNLLLTVLQRTISKRKWAFSNLAYLIRIHLFNYINIYKFLINPSQFNQQIPDNDFNLFSG
jgi:Domain of unknown function (DUF4372)/Transposase DDE domain